MSDYESYIKHYPLAEARHRSELKKNPQYQAFIQKCSLDPRIRKRDLITFLSRPVTRLPRLCLVLEHILKLTQQDHPDLENLPLILSILNEFVKSTQPGIAAAEGKVKFWSLCESLVYMRGEIIASRILSIKGLGSDTVWSRKWTCMMTAGHWYIQALWQDVCAPTLAPDGLIYM